MKLLQSFFTPGNGLASLTLALLHFFNSMDGEREANKTNKEYALVKIVRFVTP